MTIREARPDDLEVDIHSLAHALFRSLRYLVPIAIVIAVATYAALTQVTPLYKAEGKILIEASESLLTRPTADNNAETQALLDQEGIMSQVQLVRSREVARAVVQKLNLGSLPEFDPLLKGPGLVTRILSPIGLARDPSRTSAEERVLDSFFQKLSVYPVEKSRVIVIEFTASDPELAARITNAIAEQYLVVQQAAQRSTNQDATAWLESEIADLRVKVREAEARVESFRSSSDLFAGAGENGTTLAQQQLVELNAELTRVRAARAEAEAKASQIRAGLENGNALNSLDVLKSELIQRLSEQAVALRAQIAQLSAMLLPGHPRMRELNAQLADLDNQIRREARKLLAGLEADARLAQARESELSASLTRQKLTATKSNDDSVQLRALEREASAQRELLETYLRRYREALARQNGNYLPANARIISRAAAPVEPSFPKKGAMSAAAMIGALILGACFVLIRELATRKPVHALRYSEPLPIVPDELPVQGKIRHVGDRPRRLPPGGMPGDAASSDTERSLASIARRIVELGASRVVVAMAEEDPPAGRPLAAVALARALARSGVRVVLADFRHDGADGEAMGDGREKAGFCDLYAGNVSFAQVIFRDRSSPAHFIPAGLEALPEGWEDDPRFATLIDALDHTYDHLIIDADAAALAALGPGAGVIVLVTELGPADPRVVRAYAAARTATAGEVMLLVAEAEPPAVAAA